MAQLNVPALLNLIFESSGLHLATPQKQHEKKHDRCNQLHNKSPKM